MDILNAKQKESESREQGGFIEVSVCLLLMHGYNTIYKYLQKYFVIKSLKSSALVCIQLNSKFLKSGCF